MLKIRKFLLPIPAVRQSPQEQRGGKISSASWSCRKKAMAARMRGLTYTIPSYRKSVVEANHIPNEIRLHSLF